MTRKAGTRVPCLVCGAESQLHKLVPNWGEMRRCVECGLIFARCLSTDTGLPDGFFDEAYRGGLSGEMRHFNLRLRMRSHIRKMGRGYLDPRRAVFESSIGVLRDRFAQGSYVLDIGCGTGSFMDRLEEEGFQPLGLDIAALPVAVLREDGRQVCHGSVESVPRNWPEPVACTMHFVLHHVDNPVDFLGSIRTRFPNSVLIVADINASRRVYPAFRPPRHLTIWTAKSLQWSLRRAGYESQVFELPVPLAYGESMTYRLFLGLPSWLRRETVLRVLLAVKRSVVWALAPVFRALGRDMDVVAVAQPRPSGPAK